MERCVAVLDLMSLRPDGYWFANPVPVELVPDYPEVITSPMDYSTVRQRLEDGGHYGEDPLAFAADMRLIFTNAVTYNWKPDHDCHKAAVASLRAFEHYFSRSRGLTGTPLEATEGGASSAKSAGSKGAQGKHKRKTPMPTPSSGAAPGSADGGAVAGADGSGAPPARKKSRSSIDGSEMDSGERSVKLLQSLAEYLEMCGGSQSMVDGWYTKTEFRKEGATAGTYDSYFFSPQGKRFRSRAEIARFFALEAAPAPRGGGKSAEVKAAEKAAAQDAKRAAKDAERAERDAAHAAAIAYARRDPITSPSSSYPAHDSLRIFR